MYIRFSVSWQVSVGFGEGGAVCYQQSSLSSLPARYPHVWHCLCVNIDISMSSECCVNYFLMLQWGFGVLFWCLVETVYCCAPVLVQTELCPDSLV